MCSRENRIKALLQYRSRTKVLMLEEEQSRTVVRMHICVIIAETAVAEFK